MSEQAPGFRVTSNDQGEATLYFSGDWLEGQDTADFSALQHELATSRATSLAADGSQLGRWDSLLMAFLLQCHDHAREHKLPFKLRDMPSGVEKLLSVATAVPTHKPAEENTAPWLALLHPGLVLNTLVRQLRDSLAFLGEAGVALYKLVRGSANTLYVADLVVIGMLREMGVLMTAVVMAGRTGAAYAAQLGTMQTNEEIDAIITLGVSPMEFLVMPRMLALVVVMPMLTIYADLLGMFGGGLVAATMGITPLQYIKEGETVFSFAHMSVGLIKSVVFGILIAIAGCRAGMNSGRSSAAVGQAATTAVVTAVVYLIIADAGINILFQQMGI
jgi:phospholipid/cholesterol/gamma-HCH transport system permease protein